MQGSTGALEGRYDISWFDGGAVTSSQGVITELDERAAIVVATDNRGDLDFRLREFAGGARGTGTVLRLTVSVAIEPVFAAGFERRGSRISTGCTNCFEAIRRAAPRIAAGWGRGERPLARLTGVAEGIRCSYEQNHNIRCRSRMTGLGSMTWMRPERG